MALDGRLPGRKHLTRRGQQQVYRDWASQHKGHVSLGSFTTSPAIGKCCRVQSCLEIRSIGGPASTHVSCPTGMPNPCPASMCRFARSKSGTPKGVIRKLDQADPGRVVVPCKLRFRFSEVCASSFPIPPRPEGRIAIVTNVRRDAVAAMGRETSASRCGRRSRVVLAPRSRRQVREDANASRG